MESQTFNMTTVGVNIASIAPWVITPTMLKAGVHMLKNYGLEFVSVLPVIGMDGLTRNDLALPVTHMEGAWNPTNKAGIAGWGEVLNGIGRSWLNKMNQSISYDPGVPKWQDALIFYGRKDNNLLEEEILRTFNHPVNVVHSDEFAFRPFGLSNQSYVRQIPTVLEVNPNMGNTIQAVLEENEKLKDEKYIQANFLGFDFDTKHVREEDIPGISERTVSYPGAPTTDRFSNWQEVLQQVEGNLALVDFQAKNKSELNDTLDGQRTELNDMLLAIKESGYIGPVRIENNIGIAQLNPLAVLDVLYDTKDYIFSTLEVNSEVELS